MTSSLERPFSVNLWKSSRKFSENTHHRRFHIITPRSYSFSLFICTFLFLTTKVIPIKFGALQTLMVKKWIDRSDKKMQTEKRNTCLSLPLKYTTLSHIKICCYTDDKLGPHNSCNFGITFFQPGRPFENIGNLITRLLSISLYFHVPHSESRGPWVDWNAET